MSIIDVRDWEKEVYGFGTRKKYLYIDPKTRRKAFFKYPMVDEQSGEIIIGEVWSEKIAADIGRVIEIPTPEVAIAKNEDGFGSLSFSFLEDGEQLYHGAEFLNVYFAVKEIGEHFNPINLRHHKLDYILEITWRLNVQNNIIDILIYDALIGNTDRHSENWGLVSNMNNSNFKLAPAYDNSSSLAREFKNDEKRLLLLKDKNMLNHYIEKASACISTSEKKRTKHFDLVNMLLNINRKCVRDTIKKISYLDNTSIDAILSNVPDIIMSSASKELVKKILNIRKDKLLTIRR
jgi:hypothetical protein